MEGSFFGGEGGDSKGVVPRDEVEWHCPQPGGLLDWGFYRAGERFSKEPGCFVGGSRALQVMLCQHEGVQGMRRDP